MPVPSELHELLNIVDDCVSDDSIVDYAQDREGFQSISVTPYLVRIEDRVEMTWITRLTNRIKKSEIDGFKHYVQLNVDSMSRIIKKCYTGSPVRISHRFIEVENFGEYLTLETIVTVSGEIDVPGSDIPVITRKAGLLPILLDHLEDERALPMTANFLAEYGERVPYVKSLHLFDDYSYYNHAYSLMGIF